jgi:hypothetical protein
MCEALSSLDLSPFVGHVSFRPYKRPWRVWAGEETEVRRPWGNLPKVTSLWRSRSPPVPGAGMALALYTQCQSLHVKRLDLLFHDNDICVDINSLSDIFSDGRTVKQRSIKWKKKKACTLSIECNFFLIPRGLGLQFHLTRQASTAFKDCLLGANQKTSARYESLLSHLRLCFVRGFRKTSGSCFTLHILRGTVLCTVVNNVHQPSRLILISVRSEWGKGYAGETCSGSFTCLRCYQGRVEILGFWFPGSCKEARVLEHQGAGSGSI